MKYFLIFILAWIGHWNVCETTIEKSLPRYSGRDAKAFVILTIPDTQLYSETWDSLFYEQTQWILDHRDSLNIQFVLHVGDIVNVCADANQWDVADSAMKILDGQVDYLVIEGNHDYRCGNYKTYFPVSRFDTCDYWGGNMNDYNWYAIKTIYDRTYVFLGLEYCPSTADSAMQWADSLLTAHSDKKFIIWTHSYLHHDGQRAWYTDGLDPLLHYSGDEMWDDVFSNHDNIILITSGHTCDVDDYTAHRTDTINGNPVNQTLQDFQCDTLGGNGWLCYYKFVPSRNDIWVYTYSTHLDSFRMDSEFYYKLKDHKY